jgi:hypothetical protein
VLYVGYNFRVKFGALRYNKRSQVQGSGVGRRTKLKIRNPRKNCSDIIWNSPNNEIQWHQPSTLLVSGIKAGFGAGQSETSDLKLFFQGLEYQASFIHEVILLSEMWYITELKTGCRNWKFEIR